MAPKRKQTSSSSDHGKITNKKFKNFSVKSELKKFMTKHKFPYIAPIGIYRNIDCKAWLTSKDHNGNYPLFIGCQLDGMEQLSLHMINIFPDAIKQEGWSGKKNPFHLACAAGNINIIIQLLKINNNLIHGTDMDGRTPFFYACKYQRMEVIRYLVNKTDIDINVKDSNNQTAFHFCCHIAKFDSCTELLNYDKLIGEGIDNDGNTPLFTIIISMIKGKNSFKYSNSILVIKKLLNKYPNSIGYCTSDGCNILHKIIGNSHIATNLCKYYWEFMVFNNSMLINNIDKDNGFTPIHYACIFMNIFPSYLLKTSMIITRNYNPCVMINTQDKIGQTALHLTCKMHKYSAFQELINYKGINIEIVDKFGNTILHAVVDEMPSVSIHSFAMIKVILEKSPFMILHRNSINNTAIDLVHRHFEYATELVEFGNGAAEQDLLILTKILFILQEHRLNARNAMFDYMLCNMHM